MNLALDALPDFKCLPGPGAHLRGAISISPSIEYMERAYDDAKYGHFSRKPYIDMVIPSLTDPSVAPPGKHVLSCFVQYAPYKLAEGTWDDQREAFGDTVVNTIAEHAPNIKKIIIGRQVLTPLDLEREFGLTQGNIFQGELSLEQLFFLRPVPGWAYYRTPIDNLYMCGSATHPGGGIMGAPGRIASQVILRSWKRVESSSRASTSGRSPRRPTNHAHRTARSSHRRRPQRSRHRVLSRQRRLQAARSRTPRNGRRRRRHRGISSRFPRLHSRSHRWPASRRHCSRSCSSKNFDCEILRPDPRVFAPTPDGQALLFYNDHAKTAAGIARLSAKDAAKYTQFAEALEHLADVLARKSLSITPPAIDSPSPEDLWNLFKTGRGVRSLGKNGIFDLLRWGPMAVADFVAEFFETELLRAVIAARGIFGTALGPWSAGSHRRASSPRRRGLRIPSALPHFRAVDSARSLSRSPMPPATPALKSAPMPKFSTSASKTAPSPASFSPMAKKSPSRPSSPASIPSALSSSCVDPSQLDPTFALRIRNIRANGTVAKVNLALGGLPVFPRSRRLSKVFSTLSPAASTSARKSIISSAPSTPPNTANFPPHRISTSPSPRFSIPRSRPKASTSFPPTSNSLRTS